MHLLFRMVFFLEVVLLINHCAKNLLITSNLLLSFLCLQVCLSRTPEFQQLYLFLSKLILAGQTMCGFMI